MAWVTEPWGIQAIPPTPTPSLLMIRDTNNRPKYHIMKVNCFWFACKAIWCLAADTQAEDCVMEDFHGNDS